MRLQDLFSEPLPQPRGQPLHAPPGAGLPYGAAGAQGVPLHPGYRPHELVAYPVGPSGRLPQGYLQIDPHYLAAQGQQPQQQQYAMPSAAGPAPGVAHPGAGSPPGGGMEGLGGGPGPAESDAFSGLVPGLRSSLPTAAQPSPASVPQQQQPSPFGQQQLPESFSWFNSGAQQQGAAQQIAPPLRFDGGFGGAGLAPAAPPSSQGGGAFQPAPAKRGGNPFA